MVVSFISDNWFKTYSFSSLSSVKVTNSKFLLYKLSSSSVKNTSPFKNFSIFTLPKPFNPGILSLLSPVKALTFIKSFLSYFKISLKLSLLISIFLIGSNTETLLEISWHKSLSTVTIICLNNFFVI